MTEDELSSSEGPGTNIVRQYGSDELLSVLTNCSENWYLINDERKLISAQYEMKKKKTEHNLER